MGMLDLDNPGKPAVMSCDTVWNGVMSSESGIVFVFTVRSSSLNPLPPPFSRFKLVWLRCSESSQWEGCHPQPVYAAPPAQPLPHAQ